MQFFLQCATDKDAATATTVNVQTNKRAKECEYCGKDFVNLKSHILSVHKREECKHKCHVCLKRFQKPSSLIRHLTEVHGKEKAIEEPFVIDTKSKEIKTEVDYIITDCNIKEEALDTEEEFVNEEEPYYQDQDLEHKIEPIVMDNALVDIKEEQCNDDHDNEDQYLEEHGQDYNFLPDNPLHENFVDYKEEFVQDAEHEQFKEEFMSEEQYYNDENEAKYESIEEVGAKTNDFVKCEDCCTVFKSILDCDSHLCVPKGQRPVVLTVGEKPAADAAVQDLPRRHKCDQCDKMYLNRGSLRRHVRDEHENEHEHGKIRSKIRGSDSNLCLICNTQFDQSYLLKLHMKKAHNVATDQLPGYTKARPQLKCPHCEKVYYRKESVRRHIKDAHSEDKQKSSHETSKGVFPCDQCDKIYDLKGKLRRHVRIVHEAAGSGYCDSCDGAFFRDITRHMIVAHTNEKPIECPECHKTIGKNYSLQRHLKICQGAPVANAGPKLCDLCGTECENQLELRKHKKKVHLISSVSQKKPRVIEKVPCPHCGKSLAGKTALNVHIRTIHEKRRDFMCNECGKCFTQRVALQVHIKGMHSDEKRAGYACPKCDKVWSSERGRQLHMEKTHNEKYMFGCQNCPQKFEFKPLLRAHLELCSAVK